MVKLLIYEHGHSDAKKDLFFIQKRLTNGLDFDQSGEIISQASQELSFIHTRGEYIWYVQNRAMLLYVRDETEMNLNFLADKFDHLKPPDLAEEFGL